VTFEGAIVTKSPMPGALEESLWRLLHPASSQTAVIAHSA
jgi:hypothetical protein